MSTSQINPTRMELQKLRDKLATTTRGHKLLKDKQDELIHEFIPLLPTYRALREKVEKALRVTLTRYQFACVKMSKEAINDHINDSVTTHELSASFDRVMGVIIPKLETKPDQSELNYDLIATTSAFDELIKAIQDLFALLIELANLESTIKILVAEIEKSKRRVNAIENIIIKEIEEQIRVIRMKLTDLERSNTIRMMKSKEIIIEKKLKENK
ncbi:MAG: V-type sodium ATPase subunit D [Tenericutes bacterium ADurb.Bin239]|nr:MAG: V-type sodium ATPase subunit D [Tenericutes bacterium ADurb.Bin239]